MINDWLSIIMINSIPWNNLGASRGHRPFAGGHLQIFTQFDKLSPSGTCMARVGVLVPFSLLEELKWNQLKFQICYHFFLSFFLPSERDDLCLVFHRQIFSSERWVICNVEIFLVAHKSEIVYLVKQMLEFHDKKSHVGHFSLFIWLLCK